MNILNHPSCTLFCNIDYAARWARQTFAPLALVALASAAGAQTPPAPPAPPAPPSWTMRGAEESLSRVWIGVETSSVPAVVARQLGRPRGYGLVIDRAVPEGPAAQAGVQNDDILWKFEDQMIVNNSQLRVLVQNRQAGDKVRVTVLRENKELVLEVTLAERPDRRMGQGDGDESPLAALAELRHLGQLERLSELRRLGETQEWQEVTNGWNEATAEITREVQAAVREAMQNPEVANGIERTGEEWAQTVARSAREIAIAVREAQAEARRAEVEAAKAGRAEAYAAANEARAMGEAARANAERLRNRIVTVETRGDLPRVTRLHVAQATKLYTDDAMSVSLREEDGKTLVEAKALDGKLIWQGDIANATDRAAMPPEVAERVAHLERIDEIPLEAPQVDRVQVIVPEPVDDSLSLE